MDQFVEDAGRPGGLPAYTFIEPNMSPRIRLEVDLTPRDTGPRYGAKAQASLMPAL